MKDLTKKMGKIEISVIGYCPKYIPYLNVSFDDSYVGSIAGYNLKIFAQSILNRFSRGGYNDQQYIEELENLILWLQGERGDFPIRGEKDGAYYWRTELRKRFDKLKTRHQSGKYPHRSE